MDYRNSPTKNVKLNLSIIGKLEKKSFESNRQLELSGGIKVDRKMISDQLERNCLFPNLLQHSLNTATKSGQIFGTLYGLVDDPFWAVHTSV